MTGHFLDFTAPGFSTRSPAVEAARTAHWCARTPYGLAVLRHREAGLLLRDRRLRQGSHAWPKHTGLTGAFADFWMNSVISKEGREHKHLRSAAIAALKPAFLESLSNSFEQIAHNLLDDIEGRDSCDFMTAFSMPFSGQAICLLLGLPLSDWRRVAEDAARLGLAMGVNAKHHEAQVNAACTRLFALAKELVASQPAGPASFVSRLKEAAGGITPDELLNLIVISIFGGVDTTRSQLAHGMCLFIDHPQQWQLLKTDEHLIANAIEEMIRAFPTTTWSSREALESFEFNGQTISAGDTIHILVHASARDPAICANPNFDIAANNKVHFGFGGGAHHCLGAAVARTDMAAAWRVLRARLKEFHYAGTAEFLPDSGNTSPLTLPLRLVFENGLST